MTYKDINVRFSEKVSEYISKGYCINSATMSGSQGEIAKVDVTNGKEIIRIYLVSTYLGFKAPSSSCLKLVVGRCTDKVMPNWSNSHHSIIWCDNLEVISEDIFYCVNEYRLGWYSTKEEAETAKAVRFARRNAQFCFRDNTFPESAKRIVLPFLRKQPRCKTMKLSDITSVSKEYRDDKVRYAVRAKGNVYYLG